MLTILLLLLVTTSVSIKITNIQNIFFRIDLLLPYDKVLVSGEKPTAEGNTFVSIGSNILKLIYHN